LDTYDADFFTCNFFYFSALDAEAASKAPIAADLPAAGRVCHGEAIATVIKGSACPSVVAAVPVDGSTVTEDTSCSFTILPLTASSTLSLVCFGFGELGLKNQEKGENSIKTINNRQ
jgi:hypothetical protein